jgi:hypothetical protein
MKSKLFRILGVVAVVAMLAAAIVAPVSATVSAVSVTIAAHPATDGDISTTSIMTIYATLGTQLVGSTNAVTLPYVGDQVTYTATTATDKVTLTTVSGTPTLAGGHDAGLVITFAAIGQTETITAGTGGYSFTAVVNIGAPTLTTTATATTTPSTNTAAPGAFTMPVIGESVFFTSAAANDKVTLTFTTGAVATAVFSPATTTGGYAAGVITFDAVGQTCTITGTVANTAGSWARTVGTAQSGAASTTTAISKAATGATITVTFPAGFTVAAPTATIAAGTGWVTFPGASVPASVPAVLTTAPVWSFNATNLTITATLPQGDYIGANAQILINLTNGVTNPSTAGSYTLTLATSAESTAVTSAAFSITNPVPAAVQGIASVYNMAATPVLVNQYNSLATAIGTALGVSGGATIKLTAGTYADVSTTYGTAGTSVITIQGSDPSAANVIIQGSAAWGLTGATIVVDNVTIDGTNGTFSITATKAGTLSNSIINNKNAVSMNGVGGTLNITKDTFTVKTGKTGLTMTAPVTVTGSTFNVTGTGTGIAASSDVTVSGSTFTGSANTTDAYLGNGIVSTATATTAGTSISGNTFTGLTDALNLSSGSPRVAFTGNTVTNCGQASPPAPAVSPAIIVGSATALNITGNTITNGANYIITVATGLAPVVNITQNTFTGNAKAVSSADKTATTGVVNVSRNWWGSAANVPANVTLVALTTAGLQFTPALGGAPGTASFASVAGSSTVTNPIAASATVGVNITTAVQTAATTAILGASALAANPVGVAIPSADTAVKYWDVYGTIDTSATIDFYGTTAAPITANSAILFYNSVNGTWVNAGGTANVFANYFEIYVGTATNCVMTPAQFNGTPFVLVTIPTVLGTVGAATYPTNGATSVPISPTNVTFTWPAVAGATYQFALAQASANTTANEFAILDYSDNTITNAEPLQETLQPNTVYWWEVRAVTLNSSGAVSSTGPWTVSMFTTAAAPVTTTGGTGTVVTTVVTSVVITNPVTTVVSTSTNIVLPSNTGTSSPAIPSYLLWAVIAVGAVLIIAVIVLIVRTRRIP